MPSKNSSSSHSSAARLIPQGSHAGANPIDINRPAFVIGSRKEAVRFHLESSTVSKAHCVIVAHEWGCSIHDLGSRTHTIVNGQPVEDVELHDGDIINIGRFEFKYTAPGYAHGSPRSAPRGELDVATLTDPLPINKRVIQIGRRRGGDLQFEDKAVSNIHAIIFERNARRYVRDLTSRTGTWLDGKLIHQEEILPGAVIKIGPVEIGYREILPEAESVSHFAAIPMDEAPMQLVSDEAPPSIDAEIDSVAESELDLGLIPVAENAGSADTLIPIEESIVEAETAPEPVAETPSIPVEIDEHPPEIIEPEPKQEAVLEDEDDALMALRKGWKGASSITDEPIDPVAEIAPVPPPVEEELALDPPMLDLVDVEEIVTPVSDEAIPVADEPLPIAEEEIAPPIDDLLEIAEAPILEVESISPIEEPVAEIQPESPAIAEEVIEPVEETPVESPADLTSPEPVIEETADNLLASETEIVDELPLDIGSLEDLLPEPVAETPVESIVEESLVDPVAEVLPEAEVGIPVVDDVSDDDGAIDLEEAPPVPVAEALPEPDLQLETEDAGTHETAPVIQATPEVAEIDDLIEEDDLFEEIAQHPAGSLQVVDEHEDITEIAPLTMQPVEISDESGLQEVQPLAPIGELPTEPAFADDSAVLEPQPAEPVLDLTMPLAPINEPPSAAVAPATFAPVDESINIDDLLIENEAESVESTHVEDQAAADTPAGDLVQIDDQTSQDDPDDTAFAVGMENLDPFDLDDEDPFDDPPAPFRLGKEKVEVIEPTIATPESAMPAELDETPAEVGDADLDEMLKELGLEDQLNLDDLPEGEGGDPVETHTAELTAEAERTESEITDLIEPNDSKKSTTLNDLIPKDPPLVGGLFGGMSGMAVGGSPLFDPSKPVPAKAEAPKPRPSSPPPASADAEKPHRVGFGAAPESAQPASPFSGSSKPIADVLIGRRAQQSVDVFASPSPTPEDLQEEVESTDQLDPAIDETILPDAEDLIPVPPKARTAEEIEILRTADRYRPRGVIRAMSDVPSAPPVPPIEPQAIAADRKKRLRRVFLCTILMLPLAGLAAVIAWKSIPSTSRIDATITFKRLNLLSEKDASIFRAIQDDLLTSDATQQTAVASLEQNVKEMGFLADSNKIHQVIEREPRIRWPEKPGDTMHLVMQSQNKSDDVARVRALATALIKSNSDRIVGYRELTRKIADQEAEVLQLQANVKSIVDKLQALSALGNNRPDDSTINESIGNIRKLENEIKSVHTRRIEAESKLEAIKRMPFTELATLNDDQFYKNDEELNKLNQAVEELAKKYASETEEGEKLLRTARDKQDELIKKFEQSLESAPKAANVPANLAKYVDGAKRVFKQIHDLTDELLHRQEQQRSRLSELKVRLSTKIEKQTRDVLENDEELKKNSDALEMYKRQQNAATAEGSNEEAKKLSLQIQLIQSLIDARMDKLKHDPVYEETISSLQSIIEQTEKSIQEDRKHVDQSLTLAQEEFNKTAPEVADLPAEQKEVAASIDQLSKSIFEARKAYIKAADEAETASAVRETQFKEASNSVQDKIRDRKADLLKLARDDQADRAEKARKKLLDDQGKELALLIQQEEAINKNIELVSTQQKKMQDDRRKLIENDQKRDELLSERSRLEAEIRSRNADLNNKRNQIASRIIPEEQFELQSYDDSETRPYLRPAIIGGSAGAVFLLMLIPIVWNLMLASRDSHQLAKVQQSHPEAPDAPEHPATNGSAKEEDSALLNP